MGNAHKFLNFLHFPSLQHLFFCRYWPHIQQVEYSAKGGFRTGERERERKGERKREEERERERKREKERERERKRDRY